MDAATSPRRFARSAALGSIIAMAVGLMAPSPGEAQTPPSGAASAPAANAGATTPDGTIGIVSELQGSALIVHAGKSSDLKLNDPIQSGDTLRTGVNASLAVIFDDESTFRLGANALITVDDFVYRQGAAKNSATVKFLQGTVAFAANAVARTGVMTLTTPTANLGIRGTTGVVEVAPPGAAAGSDAVKLYPDADGKVGRIEVTGHDGVVLGALSRGATGLSLTRSAGGRVVAAALAISPQQAQRDQGFVRQLHAAQQAGRAVITQRRAARAPAAARPLPTTPSRPQLQRTPAVPAKPPATYKPAVPAKQPASRTPALPARPPAVRAPQQGPHIAPPAVRRPLPARPTIAPRGSQPAKPPAKKNLLRTP